MPDEKALAITPFDFSSFTADELLAWLVEHRHHVRIVCSVGDVHWTLVRLCRVLAALSEVYTPGGVNIWLAAKHEEWGGLTYDEMVAAGRLDEVLAKAERGLGQVAT